MKPSEQKFRRGDLVRIADDLGPHMPHFTKGVDAIVLGSYADKYGGKDRKSYSLLIHGVGSLSWYDEWQLTLVKAGQTDLLYEWLDEDEDEERKDVNQ